MEENRPHGQRGGNEDSMNRIGIIGAMELEVETLKSKMKLEEIITKASMDFYKGTLDGTKVVVVKSGVGKVNAALCVQILIDVFRVSYVINTGIAGSLCADLDIGDIVISSDAVHHDMDVRIFGYALGEVPGIGIREFKADERLVALAEKCCLEANPDTSVRIGRIVSGDQFISSKEIKNSLIENFQGLCTEMEGASIAQGAYLNKIPFVIIRAISDKADDSAQEDYPTFEKKAAQHCANLVSELVSRL